MTNKDNVEIINKIFHLRAGFEAKANIQIFSEFGLTTSLFEPLKMIEAGIDSNLEMRKWVRESAASLTQKINKLEEIGLVQRELCKTDKRKWILSFTKKGKDIMKKIQKKMEKNSENIFKTFSEKEKKELLRGLEKLEWMMFNLKNKKDEK